MKKILGISLVALMSVTAANAEIASKAYVDSRDTAAIATAEGYTDTRLGNIASDTTVAQAIADAVSGGTAAAVAWSGVTGKPTTVSGYGITDAYTKTEADTQFVEQSQAASISAAGIIAIADTADIQAGTNTTKAVTPAQLKAVADNASSANSNLASRMDTAETNIGNLQTADNAINAKIGDVPANSTVMAEIAAAQTAATYDDTALAGRVSANESAISAINNATTGIAAVAAADATTKVNALANGAVADNTSAINAMTTSAGTAETGVAVLTRVSDGQGGYTYNWESIERGNNL